MPNKLFSLENNIKRQRKHIIKDCFSESHVTKFYEESVLPEIFEQLETIWNTNMFTKNEENNPKELVFDKFISKVVKLAVLEIEYTDLYRKRKVNNSIVGSLHTFCTKLQKNKLTV